MSDTSVDCGVFNGTNVVRDEVVFSKLLLNTFPLCFL